MAPPESTLNEEYEFKICQWNSSYADYVIVTIKKYIFFFVEINVYIHSPDLFDYSNNE